MVGVGDADAVRSSCNRVTTLGSAMVVLIHTVAAIVSFKLIFIYFYYLIWVIFIILIVLLFIIVTL